MIEKNFLHRLNPSWKLASHFAFMLLLVIIRDPYTTFFMMLIPATLVYTLVPLPLKRLLLYTAPFFVMFVLSTWSIAAFGRGETVWLAWGWFHFTEEGFFNGLTIGFRMLAYLYYGLLFLLTTDITSFVLSLMQQCRLKPKWAYALLAGVRFVPLFKNEYEQIRAAHRVRGIHREKGMKARIRAALRYTIPLLSQGIRKAERVAIALEARGFDGSWNRTFYRTVPSGKRDVYYFILLLFLHLVAVSVSAKMGYLRWGIMI